MSLNEKKEKKSDNRRSSILKRQDTIRIENTEVFGDGPRTPRRVSFASTYTIKHFNPIPWHNSVSDESSSSGGTIHETFTADVENDDIFQRQHPITSSNLLHDVIQQSEECIERHSPPTLDASLAVGTEIVESESVQNKTILFTDMDETGCLMETTANISQLSPSSYESVFVEDFRLTQHTTITEVKRPTTLNNLFSLISTSKFLDTNSSVPSVCLPSNNNRTVLNDISNLDDQPEELFQGKKGSCIADSGNLVQEERHETVHFGSQEKMGDMELTTTVTKTIHIGSVFNEANKQEISHSSGHFNLSTVNVDTAPSQVTIYFGSKQQSSDSGQISKSEDMELTTVWEKTVDDGQKKFLHGIQASNNENIETSLQERLLFKTINCEAQKENLHKIELGDINGRNEIGHSSGHLNRSNADVTTSQVTIHFGPNQQTSDKSHIFESDDMELTTVWEKTVDDGQKKFLHGIQASNNENIETSLQERLLFKTINCEAQKENMPASTELGDTNAAFKKNIDHLNQSTANIDTTISQGTIYFGPKQQGLNNGQLSGSEDMELTTIWEKTADVGQNKVSHNMEVSYSDHSEKCSRERLPFKTITLEEEKEKELKSDTKNDMNYSSFESQLSTVNVDTAPSQVTIYYGSKQQSSDSGQISKSEDMELTTVWEKTVDDGQKKFLHGIQASNNENIETSLQERLLFKTQKENMHQIELGDNNGRNEIGHSSGHLNRSNADVTTSQVTIRFGPNQQTSDKSHILQSEDMELTTVWEKTVDVSQKKFSYGLKAPNSENAETSLPERLQFEAQKENMYNIECKNESVHSSNHNIECKNDSVHSSNHNIECKNDSVHSSNHNIECKNDSVHSSNHNIECKNDSVHSSNHLNLSNTKATTSPDMIYSSLQQFQNDSSEQSKPEKMELSTCKSVYSQPQCITAIEEMPVHIPKQIEDKENIKCLGGLISVNKELQSIDTIQSVSELVVSCKNRQLKLLTTDQDKDCERELSVTCKDSNEVLSTEQSIQLCNNSLPRVPSQLLVNLGEHSVSSLNEGKIIHNLISSTSDETNDCEISFPKLNTEILDSNTLQTTEILVSSDSNTLQTTEILVSSDSNTLHIDSKEREDLRRSVLNDLRGQLSQTQGFSLGKRKSTNFDLILGHRNKFRTLPSASNVILNRPVSSYSLSQSDTSCYGNNTCLVNSRNSEPQFSSPLRSTQNVSQVSQGFLLSPDTSAQGSRDCLSPLPEYLCQTPTLAIGAVHKLSDSLDGSEMLDDQEMPDLSNSSIDGSFTAPVPTNKPQRPEIQLKDSTSLSDFLIPLGINISRNEQIKKLPQQHISTLTIQDKLKALVSFVPKIVILKQYLSSLESARKKVQQDCQSKLLEYSQQLPAVYSLMAQNDQTTVSCLSKMIENSKLLAYSKMNKHKVDHLQKYNAARESVHEALQAETNDVLTEIEQVVSKTHEIDERLKDMDFMLQEKKEGNQLEQIQFAKDQLKLQCKESLQKLDNLQTENEASHKKLTELLSSVNVLKEEILWTNRLTEWRVLKTAENEVDFGFLWKTLTLNIKYSRHSKIILTISLKQHLSDASQPWAKCAVAYAMSSINCQLLHESYPNIHKMNQLLDEVSTKVFASRQLSMELKNLYLDHEVTINNDSLTVVVSDRATCCKIHLETTISPNTYPNKQLPWKVRPLIGHPRLEVLQEAIEGVCGGEGYLTKIMAVVKHSLSLR